MPRQVCPHLHFSITQMKITNDSGIVALRLVKFLYVDKISKKSTYYVLYVLLQPIKGLFQYCRQRGIKVSDDLDENTFRDIAVQKSLPRTLQDMSDHFQTAVNKAQKHFLANRRAVDVQNMSGIVMKCDVKLSESNPDQYVNVWPHGDGRMREGIPLNRGTLPALLTNFLYHSLFY
jgi:hypothetical protein